MSKAAGVTIIGYKGGIFVRSLYVDCVEIYHGVGELDVSEFDKINLTLVCTSNRDTDVSEVTDEEESSSSMSSSEEGECSDDEIEVEGVKVNK